MIDELKEVIELATNTVSFINNIMKLESKKVKKTDKDGQIIKSSGYFAKIGSSGDSAKIGSSGDSAQIGSSGYSAQIGSSGYFAKIGSSGYSAQIGSTGYYAKIGSSGDSAQIGSSGDYAQIGSSGDYAKIGSSGYSTQIGSSGYSAQIGSSGDYAQIGSSGYSAQIGSSGYFAKIGSSGDYAKIESAGQKSVIAGVGCFATIKATKGSWITLAEYQKDEQGNYYPYFVKSEQVDGEKIKENTFYGLYNKEFREIIEVDEIKNLLISQKGNIKKVVRLGEFVHSYVFTKNGISAHGNTVKQAYHDWLFKQSDRNVEKYRDLNPDEVHTLEYWYECYRIITGACSAGTEYFIEQNKPKKEMTLSEVIEITKGQYGHNTFVEFFRERK